MPYDPMLVAPMKEELTSKGIEGLTTADEVVAAFERPGTTLVVVNSVCGCAAGTARPSVIASLEADITPDHVVTVFAGQDIEATNKAREFFEGMPPSSPCFALLKDGKLQFMIHRYQIESNSPEVIVEALKEAYAKFCA